MPERETEVKKYINMNHHFKNDDITCIEQWRSSTVPEKRFLKKVVS